VLSELSKKHPNSRVAAFLNTLPKNDMLISVITPGEIIKGIEKAKDEAIKKRFSFLRKGRLFWAIPALFSLLTRVFLLLKIDINYRKFEIWLIL
jgi:predicted nucleic acid-binding protein